MEERKRERRRSGEFVAVLAR
jgi:hypothetical protein